LKADRLGTGQVTLYKRLASQTGEGAQMADGELEAGTAELCKLTKLTLKLNVSNPPAQN
jgi:hypothetical protein